MDTPTALIINLALNLSSGLVGGALAFLLTQRVGELKSYILQFSMGGVIIGVLLMMSLSASGWLSPVAGTGPLSAAFAAGLLLLGINLYYVGTLRGNGSWAQATQSKKVSLVLILVIASLFLCAFFIWSQSKNRPTIFVTGSGTVMESIMDKLPFDSVECSSFQVRTLNAGSMHAIENIAWPRPRGDLGLMSHRFPIEGVVSDPLLKRFRFIEILLAKDEVAILAHVDNPLQHLQKSALKDVLESHDNPAWKDLGASNDSALASRKIEFVYPRGCGQDSGTCRVVAKTVLGDEKKKFRPARSLLHTDEHMSTIQKDVALTPEALGFVSAYLATSPGVKQLKLLDGTTEIKLERGFWGYVPILESDNSIASPARDILKCILSKNTQKHLKKKDLAALDDDLLDKQRRWLGIENNSFKIDLSKYRQIRLGPQTDDGILLRPVEPSLVHSQGLRRPEGERGRAFVQEEARPGGHRP